MVAPSGTQWLGLGQGRGMAGTNMFVIYTSGSTNITLSPRLGRGEFRPEVNRGGEVTLLEGTGVSSDGVMTANIRCDSCITWDGGSMSPTNGNSNWIWSIRQGSALDSTDISEKIQKHDSHGAFTFDLLAGTSSDSSNPFVQPAIVTQSAGSSEPSASGDSKAGPGRSSSRPYGSSSGGESNTNQIRMSHGTIMAVVFLFLFPIGALMIHLPLSRTVPYVHAPIQVVSTCLLIVGLSLGVVLGVRYDLTYGYHQILGCIVIGCLLLFQPALGLIQHLRHRKLGERTIFGHLHRWLGRILILLGIINGGLGLHVSGEMGLERAPRWSVIAYSVIAAVVGIIYIAVVSGVGFFRKRKSGLKEETEFKNGNGNTSGSMSTN